MDAFLDSGSLNNASATAPYQNLKTLFSDANITHKKQVWLPLRMTDAANVVTGAHPVASMLQADIPGIFIMNCIGFVHILCIQHTPGWS